MNTDILWINISLMVLAFALTTGIPLWLVLRRPDKDPAETRTVPEYMRPDWENLPRPAVHR